MNTFLIPLDPLILLGSVRGQVPGKQTVRVLHFQTKVALEGALESDTGEEEESRRKRERKRRTTTQMQTGLSWSYIELWSWNDSSELLQTETTGLSIFGCWLSPGQSITWGKVASFRSGQFPEEELSCEPLAGNLRQPSARGVRSWIQGCVGRPEATVCTLCAIASSRHEKRTVTG